MKNLTLQSTKELSIPTLRGTVNSPIFAELTWFDVSLQSKEVKVRTNYYYQVKEVLMEAYEGDDIVPPNEEITRTKNIVLRTTNDTFNESEVETLYDAVKNGIQNDSFFGMQKEAIEIAFTNTIKAKGLFGLTPNDWELM